MPQTETNWPKAILAFFDSFPEFDFFVADVDPDLVRQVSAASWIYALASKPTPEMPEVQFLALREGQTTIPVVIRRAFPSEGYTTPCMIVLDDGLPLPPFHAATKPGAAELCRESFGAFIWKIAVETRKTGGTINDVLKELFSGKVFGR